MVMMMMMMILMTLMLDDMTNDSTTYGRSLERVEWYFMIDG